MNRYVKGVMLVGVGFISGAGFGGVKLVKMALGNKDIRKGVSNAVVNKIDEALWSDSPSPSRRNMKPVSYTKPYYDTNIAYGTREEAEKILDSMLEVVDKYGSVTVADMYDLSDMQASYISAAYGWRNLDGVSVISEKEGYFIELPDPIELNK